MKYSLLTVSCLLFFIHTHAQFIKEKSITAQIGFGTTSPRQSSSDVADSGFFIQGEFVLEAKSWLQFRPYAGFISTKSDGKDLNDNPTFEKSIMTAVLIGGKARIQAPIPWIAPFIELGIGASIGSFETLTSIDNIDKNGVLYHIPIGIGLGLGKTNTVEFGLTTFIHPSAKQLAGGITIGLEIPLN